jgi:hypothetical protein
MVQDKGIKTNVVDFEAYRRREETDEQMDRGPDPCFVLRNTLMQLLCNETSEFMGLPEYERLGERDQMYLLQSAASGFVQMVLAVQSVMIEEHQGTDAGIAMDAFLEYWTDELRRGAGEAILAARERRDAT